MIKEIWKDIKGYEGLYQVSNLGRVKSLPREWITGINSKRQHKEIILKSGSYLNGYLHVSLYKDNNKEIKTIHKLVAKAFILNPENKPEVNHKDGIKSHCEETNLEWNTKSENKIHALKFGLRKSGENHIQAKLTNEMVRLIKNSLTISLQEFANICNVRKQTIWKIRHNKSHKYLLLEV
jgi:hypothetical protein